MTEPGRGTLRARPHRVDGQDVTRGGVAADVGVGRGVGHGLAPEGAESSVKQGLTQLEILRRHRSPVFTDLSVFAGQGIDCGHA